LIRLRRSAFPLQLVAALSAALVSCAASHDKANCTANQSTFRYVGADNLVLKIDEVPTGSTFYLGSRDEELYLAKDLSEDGIVNSGWFAITEELIDGGQFNRANVACQGFQISTESTVVRCQASSPDVPQVYLFERGRGIVKFWWTGKRESLVTLDGSCGYGHGIA
jgi:hypothetical protein